MDIMLTPDAPHLVVFAERSCPTSRLALIAMAVSGARITVVSQGRVEAAQTLVRETGADRLPLVVDPAPHPISSARAVETVPTTILFDAVGTEQGRVVGWDRELVGALVAAAGGELIGELPASKPGCASRSTLDADAQARADADDAALGDGGEIEEMFLRGWTDGLPTVPPTPRRVAAMLDGRDPAESLGEVPPAGGELTLERLASCAVLAGCEPAHFGLVRAATEAVLDPRFNLHGVQNTTHFAAPVLVVNGPIRRRLGMSSGAGVLGPGNRANAAVGRALRLVMMLTGGARPGVLDQSTLGGPHKWGLVIPEHEEASPWEPLHVDLGFTAGDSVVTVLAGEPPAGVSDHRSSTAEGVASSLALALQHAWNPAWTPVDTEMLLVVGPEHAATFASAGWDKGRLRRELFERSKRTVGELRASGSGEVHPDVLEGPADLVLPKLADEDLLVIVVAGGIAGRYSAVIAPWLVTGPGSGLVSRRVEA